jgi:hypothetical protein
MTNRTCFLTFLSFPLFDDWNSTTRKQSPTAKLPVQLSPTSFADDMNELDHDQKSLPTMIPQDYRIGKFVGLTAFVI